MLQIDLPEDEFFDEETSSFIKIKAETIQLEHSLLSISKWESKWHKSFFDKEKKTFTETIDYIKCMTITQNVKPESYLKLSEDILKKIDDYINDPMTGTRFNEKKSETTKKVKNEGITSELIYFWMINFNIPMECQKWHFNRLQTLIRICDIKNKEASSSGKKMSKKEMLSNRAALNRARREQLQTKG